MEYFRDAGFLSQEIGNGISHLRKENADWFALCNDTNAAMMRIAQKACENTVGLSNWAAETIATRILMRSCGTFQAIILMTERGLVAEGRMMARSLVENSFCAAALVTDAEAFIKVLRDDSEASRKNQGKFIIAQQLGNSPLNRKKLQDAINKIDTKAKIMRPKDVAEKGPLLAQYLNYQRLSDDAAHLSALSISRHLVINEQKSGWSYRWGAGNAGENAATLHRAMLAMLPVGISTTQILKDNEGNQVLQALADRFHAMPPTPAI